MGLIHSALCVKIFNFIALGIHPQHVLEAGSLILLILCEDSSSTLWIRPLCSLLWFYPLSQGRFVYSDYRRLVSIVIAWIRPLLLIKLGFMAVIIFILALQGSCCVDCLSDRLSWPLILVFSHDWFC